MIRETDSEALAVIHTFGGTFPERVSFPVKADSVRRVMCSEGNRVTLEGSVLTVELKAPFEAVAVRLG